MLNARHGGVSGWWRFGQAGGGKRGGGLLDLVSEDVQGLAVNALEGGGDLDADGGGGRIELAGFHAAGEPAQARGQLDEAGNIRHGGLVGVFLEVDQGRASGGDDFLVQGPFGRAHFLAAGNPFTGVGGTRGHGERGLLQVAG